MLICLNQTFILVQGNSKFISTANLLMFVISTDVLSFVINTDIFSFVICTDVFCFSFGRTDTVGSISADGSALDETQMLITENENGDPVEVYYTPATATTTAEIIEPGAN